jgi:hypothetical protein
MISRLPKIITLLLVLCVCIFTIREVFTAEIVKPKFSTSVSLDHQMGMKDTVDDSSLISGDLIYRLNKKNMFRMVQSFNKLYEIEAGGEEFGPNDTGLFHYYTITSDWKKLKVSWRTSATLPLSTRTKDKEIRSVLGGRLSISRKFFNKNLTLGYAPYIKYFWNEFKQVQGGFDSPLYGYGHRLSASYLFSDNLSWSGLAGMEQTFSEKGRYRKRDTHMANDGGYYLDTYAEYTVIPKIMGLRVGYNHTNTQVQAGRIEMNLFDEEVSQYYIGMDYTF